MLEWNNRQIGGGNRKRLAAVPGKLFTKLRKKRPRREKNTQQGYFWAQRAPQMVDSPSPSFQNQCTGDFTRKPVTIRMSHDPNPPSAVDQAVSRALRENLERIQRTSEELHQAVGDVVAACASSRPTNALPSMLRAQTAAASISAALDVMSRFVSSAVHGSPRSQFETEMSRIASATPAVHRASPVAPPVAHRPAAPPPPPPMPAFEPEPEPIPTPTFEDDAPLPSAGIAEPDYAEE